MTLEQLIRRGCEEARQKRIDHTATQIFSSDPNMSADSAFEAARRLEDARARFLAKESFERETK